MPVDLLDRVVTRLGLTERPAADLPGLRTLYRAWCDRVPFDNVRKLISLGAGDARPFPGGRADDFLEAWLAHGAGGTCWPSSNALHAVLTSLGFDARRVAGSMRDMGVVNHGSIKVWLEGRDWLVDSSMLTTEPLPLGDVPFFLDDPVFVAEVEPVGDSHVVWLDLPPNSEYLPCRLLEDPVDHEYYLSAYERSRGFSPFNQRLFARRNLPNQLFVLFGRTRFVKTPAGLSRTDLSRNGLREALAGEIGLSGPLIDEWTRAGGLDAAFEPPAGPPPPPNTRQPPSRRRPRSASEPRPVREP